MPDFSYERELGDPASSPIHAASTRPATGASSGRCGSSPASGRRKTPTARYKALLAAGGTGLSVAFDLPTLMGRDPDHPLSLGRSGEVRRERHVARRHGGALRRHPARATSRTSMTINSPAAMIFAMYLVVAEQQGADWQHAVGHDPERHPEGVHRAEGIHLSAAPLDAARSPTSSSSARRSAAVEHDLGQRLSHPRGGLDGAAGARVHAARRHRVRAVGRRCRARRGRLRAAACRSSSTRTATSSKRSPSIARRAGSGPSRCAIASAPGTSGPGSCGSTARPPACR